MEDGLFFSRQCSVREWEMTVGAGEMALNLRAFVALAEELGSVPSSHMAAHNDLVLPFGLCRYCTHVVHLHTCWEYIINRRPGMVAHTFKHST